MNSTSSEVLTGQHPSLSADTIQFACTLGSRLRVLSGLLANPTTVSSIVVAECLEAQRQEFAATEELFAQGVLDAGQLLTVSFAEHLKAIQITEQYGPLLFRIDDTTKRWCGTIGEQLAEFRFSSAFVQLAMNKRDLIIDSPEISYHEGAHYALKTAVSGLSHIMKTTG